MTSPILVQESFRGRYDNGSETTATWIAATNADFQEDADVMFRIRFTVAETNARNSNTALTLYFSYNGGAYQDLTTTSSYIRYASSTYVTDGTLTTQQISTGTFVQGSFDDNNTVASVLLNNSKTEMEYGVIIVGADVSNGDTIAVRVYNSSSPLNSYTATPTFTVIELESDPLVNKSDSVAIGENRIITLSDGVRSVSDSVGVTENRVVSLLPAGDIDRSVSDAITLSESRTISVSNPSLSKVDTVSISENRVVQVEAFAGDLDTDGSDTVTVDEEVVYYPDEIIVSDYVYLEISTYVGDDQIIVSDSVGVSESVSASITTVVTLTSIKDTTLRSDQATTNYGNATPNYIGESNAAVAIARTLYQFDVSSIPSNAVCVSATFRIYATADFANNSGLIQVYRLLRSWVEGNGTAGSGATWNTYDGSSSWGTIGANNTSTDRESSTCGTYATTASETLNEFKDITLDSSLIQDWWDGSLTNNGLLLKTQGESDDAYGYASREYGTSTLRPKLVVEYYLSGDAPDLSIGVDDTVTINDQDYAQVSSSNANVSDSISTTESRTLVVEDAVDYHDASGQDQVAVVDYPGFQPDIIWVFEHATISIEVVQDLVTQLSDSVSVTENTTVSLVAAGALAITTSDAIGVGESSTVSVSYPLVSKSDTATVSESTTVTTSNPSRSVLDTITVSESSTVTSSTLLVSTADTVTVNETTIALVSAPVVAVFDSAAVGETAIVSLVEAGAIDISVSDTVSTADSVVISLPNLVVTKQENILVSDTANVTLAEASAITVFVTDTITTTDNVSITLSNLIATVQENVAVSEGINLILAEAGAINIVASDYPTITESTLGLTSNPVITKQDSITVSEARTLAIGVSASVQDNVSVSENRSVVRSLNTVSKSEAITVSESKSVTISSPVRSVQDNINVSEARTLSIGSSLRVQDTVSVGENRSVVRAPNAISRTDNVTVSENRSVTVSGLTRNVQDGITVTDSSIVLIAVPGMMNAIVQDSITLTENVSAVATPILRAVSDSISLSDSATVTVSSPIISRSETITVSESVQGISSSPRIFVNDSLVVDDLEQVRVATSVITVSDSLSVGEYRDVEVGEYAPYLISVQDGIILSEYANIFMPDPLRIGVYESPLVVDSPTVTVVGLLLRDTLFKGMWKGMKTGSE